MAAPKVLGYLFPIDTRNALYEGEEVNNKTIIVLGDINVVSEMNKYGV